MRYPCEGCGSTSIEERREKCLLDRAILTAPCIYCHAAPGELCRSCTGRESPQWHMQRVKAGHVLLVGRGTPCFASKAIVERGPSKGHTRSNWHRNKLRMESK